MRRSKAIRRAAIRQQLGVAAPHQAKTRWFQSHWFKAIELVALLIGVGAISYEIWQRETVDRPLAHATLQEFTAAQEARLRQYLAEPHVPFPAKVIAFQQLLAMGVSLDGLGLNCADLYGSSSTENQAYTDCFIAQDRPIELAFPQQGPTRYVSMSLNGLHLQNSVFADVHCLLCDLQYVVVSGGSFVRARFEDSDLSNMIFDPDNAEGVELRGSNVTGARFKDWHIDTMSFGGAWFWENEPPTIEDMRGNLMVLESGGGPLEIAIELGMIACDPVDGEASDQDLWPFTFACPFRSRASHEGRPEPWQPPTETLPQQSE